MEMSEELKSRLRVLLNCFNWNKDQRYRAIAEERYEDAARNERNMNSIEAKMLRLM